MSDRERRDYDVIVIGAGTAGITAAREIVRGGKSVALVERNRTGGECLYTGCVPSKTLLATARQLHQIRNARDMAIDAQPPRLDFARLKQRKDAAIAAAGVNDSPEALERSGIAVIKGSARFLGPATVSIDGAAYTAAQFVVATGSAPAVPAIPGLQDSRFLTHESILDIDDIPRRLAIVGAGPTGLELGQAFARFGSRVVVIEQAASILPDVDQDVSRLLHDQLVSEGMEILVSASIDQVELNSRGKRLSMMLSGHTRHEVHVDDVLVATGRVANSQDLSLERAGIATRRSWVVVDRQLRTTAGHIWACGDVVGPPYLTHVADDQARTVARNILAGKESWSDKAIPWSIFTDPEISGVGRSEHEARIRYGEDLEVLQLPYHEIDRAVTDGVETGMIKVMLAPGLNKGVLGGEVVGAQVVGAHAGDLVQQLAFQMRWNLPVGLFARTVQSYPTYSLGVRQAIGKHWLAPEVEWARQSTAARLKGWLGDKLPGRDA